MSLITRIGIILSIIFIESIAISLQEQPQNDIKDQYDTKFQNARHIFHCTYFEKASVLFDEILIEEPDHALIYAYAGMVDYMLYRDPRIHIQKAKQLLNEENPVDYLSRALIYFVGEDLAHCELMLKEFLKKYPNDPYAMHVLGFTQIDIGRPEDALETLTKLINSKPDYFPAYNHLGYAYLKLNKNTKAIEAFQNFLQNEELNPSAYDSYADGLTNVGKYDKAIAQLTKAVLIEPGFAYGWKHMGDIFRINGESELALEAYENARKSATLYGSRFLDSLDKAIKELKK